MCYLILDTFNDKHYIGEYYVDVINQIAHMEVISTPTNYIAKFTIKSYSEQVLYYDSKWESTSEVIVQLYSHIQKLLLQGEYPNLVLYKRKN